MKPPTPPPLLKPPLFQRGDVVKIVGTNSLGIVRSSHSEDKKVEWAYEVMFANEELVYKESALELERRALWYITPIVEQPINAEINQKPPDY